MATQDSPNLYERLGGVYSIATVVDGGGIVTSAIAAALGAAVVLFGWRMAK